MEGSGQDGRTGRQHTIGTRAHLAVLAIALAGWHAGVAAQPAGATVVHGTARMQQLGTSLLVTTTDGAGTKHSAIDWASFSVPRGSVTRFVQPGADSTSINRVTGNRPSDILGSLVSNGRLVLVNPAGIAVGKDAVVDTAGFTASALGMSDADARAGRLRFTADGRGRNNEDVEVKGQVIARNGDVLLLGTDVKVDKDAVVQAPGGTILLAAGRKVEITARGLDGIFLELTAKNDRVVNLGRLEADAVGLFASQLRHSGMIRASHVRMQDEKVRLETAPGTPGSGKGQKPAGDTPVSPGNGGTATDTGNGGTPAIPENGCTIEGGGSVEIGPAQASATPDAGDGTSGNLAGAAGNGARPGDGEALAAAVQAPARETTQMSATAVLTNEAAQAATPAEELARDMREAREPRAAGDSLVCRADG